MVNNPMAPPAFRVGRKNPRNVYRNAHTGDYLDDTHFAVAINEDDGPLIAMALSAFAEVINADEPVPEDPFQGELQALINRHSKENGSDTQDFVLAEFLTQCLRTFDYCTRYRTQVQANSPINALTELSMEDTP